MSSQAINWPNFFAVGPPRSGTTSLYLHLKKHPQVFLPAVDEPNYFATRPGMALDQYRRLYQKANGHPAIGDVSPHYLWDENTPRKIHAVSPAAKIIVTLRDPVARAHSHFLNLRRTGLELEPSFEKALRRRENKTDQLWKYSHEYVELGMYCGQIRRYLDVFGPAQVLVLLTDDFASDPLQTFARIAQYLGIDPEPFKKDDLAEAHNSFRTPRLGGLYALVRDSWVKKAVMQHLPDKVQGWLRESPMLFNYEAGKRPVLDETSRKMLQEIYDPEIERLEKLLGRQFPELRKSWV